MSASASNPPPAGAADFGRTRWSMVMAVRSGDGAEARRSLSDLCRRYWVPVYAYVRRCGHPPAAAADLVQRFLGRLVEQLRDAEQVDVDGGFREFLQQRLERFLASDPDAADAMPPAAEFAPPCPLDDIEERQRREQLAQATPSQAFQRAFALELLAMCVAQLREEAEQSGRRAMFDAVRPFLARDPVPGEYAVLAQTLQSTPLAAVVAVKRLRQRFQELIDAQLAQTVGSRRSFDSERSALLAQLAPAGR